MKWNCFRWCEAWVLLLIHSTKLSAQCSGGNQNLMVWLCKTLTTSVHLSIHWCCCDFALHGWAASSPPLTQSIVIILLKYSADISLGRILSRHTGIHTGSPDNEQFFHKIFAEAGCMPSTTTSKLSLTLRVACCFLTHVCLWLSSARALFLLNSNSVSRS